MYGMRDFDLGAFIVGVFLLGLVCGIPVGIGLWHVIPWLARHVDLRWIA